MREFRQRRSRRLSLAAAAVLAVLASGCGSEGSEVREPRLPAGLAASLATRSDGVLRTLEHGDGCAAARQARQLRTAVERAIVSGRVPTQLKAELRRRARTLARSIVCIAPAPRVEPAPPEDGDDEKDKHSDSDDEADTHDEEEE